MKHIFILNPATGKNNAKTVAHLQEQMKQYDGKLTYEFYTTKQARDATEYVRARCEAEPQEQLRFYACGGDGTANEVLNGVVGHDNASMTIYPCGSGNDFVKYYGNAERFLDLDALLNAEEAPIDVMRIGDRYALNVTHFGFDTAVTRTMEKYRHKKFTGGRKAYTMGIVKALITGMKNSCTVFVDGEQINDGSMLLCTIANGSYVGGGYKCAPHSDNTDGLLEICLARPISRFTFLKLMGVYRDGTHLEDPRFRNILAYRRGKSVRVSAPEGFEILLDGEIVAQNDFTVEVCPAAVRFAVPTEKAAVLPPENNTLRQENAEKEPLTV